MTKPALTVREVAEEIKLRQHGVLALIGAGELEAFNIAKADAKRRTLRITRESLDQFISDRTCQKPEPKRRRRRRTKQKAAVRKYF